MQLRLSTIRAHGYLSVIAVVANATVTMALGQSPQAEIPIAARSVGAKSMITPVSVVRSTAQRNAIVTEANTVKDEATPRYERRSLCEISLDISLPPGTHPSDKAEATALDDDPGAMRSNWAIDFHWTASALAIRPTYFDDVALERYGYTSPGPIQPLVSGAKFYTDVLILPYKVGFEAPRRTMYTIGYDRSGSEAQHVRGRLPWSARGAALQAGVITGFSYLIP